MRARLSVRSLSLILLCVAIAGAFGCTSSPTEPGPISESAIVSRSESFETSAAQADGAALTPEDAEAAETEDVDAEDADSNELEASGIDANDLTINAATAAGSRKVALSGVIRDRNRKAIAGVKVKSGATSTKSNSKGRFRINVRPGRVRITFSKTGYKTIVETVLVSRAKSIQVLMTATAAALSNLSLTRNDVAVGTVVTAKVTLTNAAPSRGAKVMLSSSSSAAEVPSSVTVAARKKSATFKVKAESAGTATITARYDKKSDKVTLRVTGSPTPPPVVAKFTWEPDECEIVEEPGGNPLIVKCTFDAGEAPAGSTYKWTLPDGSTITKGSSSLRNPPLGCGLPTVAFPADVRLTVTTPDGVHSDSVTHRVNFKKKGLC